MNTIKQDSEDIMGWLGGGDGCRKEKLQHRKKERTRKRDRALKRRPQMAKDIYFSDWKRDKLYSCIKTLSA